MLPGPGPSTANEKLGKPRPLEVAAGASFAPLLIEKGRRQYARRPAGLEKTIGKKITVAAPPALAANLSLRSLWRGNPLFRNRNRSECCKLSTAPSTPFSVRRARKLSAHAPAISDRSRSGRLQNPDRRDVTRWLATKQMAAASEPRERSGNHVSDGREWNVMRGPDEEGHRAAGYTALFP